MTGEPTIVVNGRTLTSGEAMSVRVAVTSMRIQLNDPEYRKELGPIADGYDRNLRTVELTMVTGR